MAMRRQETARKRQEKGFGVPQMAGHGQFEGPEEGSEQQPRQIGD